MRMEPVSTVSGPHFCGVCENDRLEILGIAGSCRPVSFAGLPVDWCARHIGRMSWHVRSLVGPAPRLAGLRHWKPRVWSSGVRPVPPWQTPRQVRATFIAVAILLGLLLLTVLTHVIAGH